jgi:hypothetical protein
MIWRRGTSKSAQSTPNRIRASRLVDTIPENLTVKPAQTARVERSAPGLFFGREGLSSWLVGFFVSGSWLVDPVPQRSAEHAVQENPPLA